MKKLAICGCSFASDFTSHTPDHDCDFGNDQLWCHRLPKELGFDQYKVFGAPGSSMFKIFLQIEEVLAEDYTHVLLLLTSPYRVNFFDSDDQNVPIKSRIGSDNAGSSEVKDLVSSKFYDETYYKKMSEITAYAMYNLLGDKQRQTSCFDPFRFKVYKNLAWNCAYSTNYEQWGPCELLDGGDGKYGHPTSPNHLNLKGQNAVLERFTKDLRNWKHD